MGTGGSFARTLVPAAIPAADYDASNAQLAFGPVTQPFDANGSLLTQTDASGTTTYMWDARNRLASISGPAVAASFGYDAVGRRISKTINGVTTTFLYDGLDIIREGGGGGDASYLRTLNIDEALSRTDGSGTSAYLADTLGSTVALADASGSPVTTFAYAPFGETSFSGTPSLNSVQFTGRENDGTGLYYYRARYYDPTRSRFVSQDPIGFESGVNFYGYAYDDPIRWADPSGLTVLECRRPLDTSLAKDAEHTLLYSTESDRGFGLGPAGGVKGFLSAYPGVRFRGRIEWERPVADGPRPQPLLPGYSCQVASTQQCVEACVNRTADETSKSPPYYKLGHYQCDTWAADVVRGCERECRGQ
jgi:RHS repeat-associated protein